MNLKSLLKVLMLLFFFGFSTVLTAANLSSQAEVVSACVLPTKNILKLQKKLMWISSSKNMCGGTYLESKIKNMKGFELTADEVDLSFEGKSTVKGNVLVHHDDKMLTANLAHIYRHNGKIQEIELIDELSFNEPNHLIMAHRGRFFIQNYSGSMSEVLYRLKLTNDPTALFSNENLLTAWGEACEAKRDPKGNVTFSQVTYSTCPPGVKTWTMKAKEIKLLKAESKGVARGTTLYFKSMPFVYLPYISFPLDTKRKSGFIGSEFAYTTQSGLDYKFPYYINIAPNLDATLKPQILSLRGLMLGGEFRYLYDWGAGITQAHFLANDKAFKSFKEANLWIAPQLAELSDNRYSFKWLHNSQLTPDLSLHIDLEMVSDDYYLQDFNNNLSLVSPNQLLREISLDYTTTHWNYRLLLQDHQTLHPFNQSTIDSVYARFPSITGQGYYPDLPYNLQLNIQTQFDNFIWQAGNSSTIPQGRRYFISPTISWPNRTSSYYIEPKVALHSSYYDLRDYNAQHKEITRVIPISSLDMGLQLEKSIFNNWYQTLEPRLYYLYVPYAQQFDVPIFDTGILLPSFNQLFRNNRFAGLDRVGDVNQLSFGLTSRLIDQYGMEKLRLSAGGFYKFQREKVSICENFQGADCSVSSDTFGYISPEVGLGAVELESELKLSRKLSVLSNLAFDINHAKVNNALINLHYEPKTNHIINAGFGFITNGDPTQLTNVSEPDINLKQFRLSYAWPYNAHWRSIGAWSYNLSHAFSTSYLVGVQYDDCCMALRFLGGQVYRNYNPNGAPSYTNNIYLQLLLKGLGSASNNDPGGIIRNFLPTFKDEFK